MVNDLGAAVRALDPLYVGYRSQTDPTVEMSILLQLARMAIPTCRVLRRVRVGGKDSKDLVTHLRTVDYLGTTNAGATHWLHCVDAVPSHEELRVVETWRVEVQSEVGGSFAQLPEGLTHMRLNVTQFEVRSGVLSAAPQLAAFRALLVKSVQSIDPQAVIVGAHQWNPDCWSFAPETT
jgi:hypothetical protein